MKQLCVLSIALGVGLTLAMASIADAIFFRPLPVPDAARIVRIPGLVSYPDFQDFKTARNVKQLIAQTQVLLAIGDAPARVRLGLAVTGDYFDALGIRARAGRVFHEAEAREPVVVLAAGADAALVGREMRIGGARFRVLGIAPEGFGLDRFVHESFYIPMRVYEAGILPGSEHVLEDRGRRFLSVIGRLAPGARMGEARAEMAGIGARLEREFPSTNRGHAASLQTEMESRLGGNPPLAPLAWLFVAAGAAMLAIASGNAGAWMLARAEAKSQELALKFALGATCARLWCAFVGESLGVALAGLLLALPLAWAAVRGFAAAATLPTDFSFSIQPRFDARVAILLAIALMVPVMTCAGTPLIAARRIEIGVALRRSPSRWRGALVALQIVLAGTLGMVTMALQGGVRAARRIDPGYRVDHVVTMAIDPLQNGYTKAQARSFFETLLERASSIAGVKRAALAQSAVLGYTRAPAMVEIGGEQRAMWMNTVTPGYFALLRLPLIAGREFDERDGPASEGAAIVNEELARQCAMGARIRVNGRVARVVGIARKAKYFDVHERIQPHVYVPFAQNFAARMTLHAEVDDARAGMESLARLIHEMDPGMAVSEARPLKESLEQGSMFAARAAADVIGGMGVCALGLALGGVLGSVAQFAARNRREIGIRAALGAPRANLIAWLARQAMGWIASGAAMALAAGAAADRLLAARIPGVEGMDGTGLMAVAAVAGLATASAVIPTVFAARMNPMVLFRPV